MNLSQAERKEVAKFILTTLTPYAVTTRWNTEYVAVLRAIAAKLEADEPESTGVREELEQERERHAETRGLVRDLTTVLEKRNAALAAQGDVATTGVPIPMRLFCPICSKQHIDAPDEVAGWTNPPHRSHECQKCGWVWRPADVPTIGVSAIKTRGKHLNESAIPIVGEYDAAVSAVPRSLV
jgi:hypothetical protein